MAHHPQPRRNPQPHDDGSYYQQQHEKEEFHHRRKSNHFHPSNLNTHSALVERLLGLNRLDLYEKMGQILFNNVKKAMVRILQTLSQRFYSKNAEKQSHSQAVIRNGLLTFCNDVVKVGNRLLDTFEAFADPLVLHTHVHFETLQYALRRRQSLELHDPKLLLSFRQLEERYGPVNSSAADFSTFPQSTTPASASAQLSALNPYNKFETNELNIQTLQNKHPSQNANSLTNFDPKDHPISTSSNTTNPPQPTQFTALQQEIKTATPEELEFYDLEATLQQNNAKITHLLQSIAKAQDLNDLLAAQFNLLGNDLTELKPIAVTDEAPIRSTAVKTHPSRTNPPPQTTNLDDPKSDLQNNRNGDKSGLVADSVEDEGCLATLLSLVDIQNLPMLQMTSSLSNPGDSESLKFLQHPQPLQKYPNKRRGFDIGNNSQSSQSDNPAPQIQVQPFQNHPQLQGYGHQPSSTNSSVPGTVLPFYQFANPTFQGHPSQLNPASAQSIPVPTLTTLVKFISQLEKEMQILVTHRHEFLAILQRFKHFPQHLTLSFQNSIYNVIQRYQVDLGTLLPNAVNIGEKSGNQNNAFSKLHQQSKQPRLTPHQLSQLRWLREYWITTFSSLSSTLNKPNQGVKSMLTVDNSISSFGMTAAPSATGLTFQQDDHHSELEMAKAALRERLGIGEPEAPFKNDVLSYPTQRAAANPQNSAYGSHNDRGLNGSNQLSLQQSQQTQGNRNQRGNNNTFNPGTAGINSTNEWRNQPSIQDPGPTTRPMLGNFINEGLRAQIPPRQEDDIGGQSLHQPSSTHKPSVMKFQIPGYQPR